MAAAIIKQVLPHLHGHEPHGQAHSPTPTPSSPNNPQQSQSQSQHPNTHYSEDNSDRMSIVAEDQQTQQSQQQQSQQEAHTQQQQEQQQQQPQQEQQQQQPYTEKEHEEEKHKVAQWHDQHSHALLEPHEVAQDPSSKPVGHSAPTLSVNDFHLIKTLGTGTFARVWLVQLRDPLPEDVDKVFALKILRKVDGEFLFYFLNPLFFIFTLLSLRSVFFFA